MSRGRKMTKKERKRQWREQMQARLAEVFSVIETKRGEKTRAELKNVIAEALHADAA